MTTLIYDIKRNIITRNGDNNHNDIKRSIVYNDNHNDISKNTYQTMKHDTTPKYLDTYYTKRNLRNRDKEAAAKRTPKEGGMGPLMHERIIIIPTGGEILPTHERASLP